MTKTIAIVSILLLSLATHSVAGIRAENIGCGGAFFTYLVSWWGPWSPTFLSINIYTSNDPFESGPEDWDFYTGNLAEYGCISSPYYDTQYMIMGATSATPAVYPGAWTEVPLEYCDGTPNL